LQSLENYGRKFDRVLPLLFQSHQAVDDEEFTNFIKTLLVSYDHGLPGCKGEPTTIKRANLIWHWCPKHKAWTIHTPAQCKGTDWKPKPTQEPTQDKE